MARVMLPARTVASSMRETLDTRAVRLAAGERPASQASRMQAPSSTTGEVLDPGAVPIDAERVQIIRKAIENGTYPLVPAKIADAVIAAGILLRKSA